jgi:hypothetical protein
LRIKARSFAGKGHKNSRDMQPTRDCFHGGIGAVRAFDCKQKRAHPIDMPVKNTVLRKVLLTDAKGCFTMIFKAIAIYKSLIKSNIGS